MPLDHEQQGRTINRRGLIMLGGTTLGLGVLATRLYQLQILDGAQYLAEAERNQTAREVLLPKRGAILDARGYRIADSVVEYDLVLLEEFQDFESHRLKEILRQLDLAPDEESALTDRMLSDHRRPLLLRRHVSPEQLARLEFHRPNLPKFAIRQQMRRQYHNKNFTPVTGYVGRADKTDRTRHALLEEFRIGRTGIEKQYEHLLQGESGHQFLQVDVFGRQLREKGRFESTAGNTVQLHIHGDLQNYAMQRLAEHRSAAAVVLDAHTGGIKALASHPFYDANDFKSGISDTLWRDMMHDPLKPMINKTISGLYAPGSTFKPIVALAALKAGISPETVHYCGGYINAGKARFHCWKKHGHGQMNMHQAIVESCDVWFYQTARKIGIEAIAETARELGFGIETGLDLDNEKAGLVPDTHWKRQKFNTPFYPGEVMIHGIGQGFLLATPLQLARAYACIINGGFLLTPTLAQRLKHGEQDFHDLPTHLPQPVDISRQHFTLIREALMDAVNTRSGTAWRSRIAADWGFDMAGKTGTTQVRRISQSERREGIRKEDIAWHLRDHALFTGFAPRHDPRYVVAVLVEHGISGGKAAAPIARDLFYRMAQLGMIKT